MVFARKTKYAAFLPNSRAERVTRSSKINLRRVPSEYGSYEGFGDTSSPDELAQMACESMPAKHGTVVIAAITSCTNTSNPAVMITAGLLAKNAVGRGLRVKPWVKTSLAPGSQVVTDYQKNADLLQWLEKLNFLVVAYGCTTCIGNSGPLPAEVIRLIEENDLITVSVLSGNRNFEGRINQYVRANYLASPPLIIAYALAGRINIDFASEPLGEDTSIKSDRNGCVTFRIYEGRIA